MVRTTSAAAVAVGERRYVGVWPGWRAMGRRVEALAGLLLLAERLVVGSSPCLFESLLRHGHGVLLLPP